MYYLVLFRPGAAGSNTRLNAEHEAFVDRLIRANRILLGGNLSPRDELPGGYLLACASREEAEELVRTDPYVQGGVFDPRVLEWRLVAINPDAIDPELIVRPGDVGKS